MPFDCFLLRVKLLVPGSPGTVMHLLTFLRKLRSTIGPVIASRECAGRTPASTCS